MSRHCPPPRCTPPPPGSLSSPLSPTSGPPSFIAPLARSLRASNRIMEWRPRCSALVLLIGFVDLAAGLAFCPVPSIGDSILRRCNLGPTNTTTLGGYQIGVVKGDETSLQRALSIIQRTREGYVALLFYASWCPFSKICQPNFQMLSELFPAIPHLAIEESVIGPSILSRYGVHGFPTLLLLNSTMRVRYHGPRTMNSLVAFYNHVTGVDPSAKPMPMDKIMDQAKVTEHEEDMQENCPFSWARSPEKLLQQDGYLALASSFLLMRFLSLVLPRLYACVQRAWRRQMRYARMRHLWNYIQACTGQAKRGVGRLYPCKQRNLQEGAMNTTRAWASQSLASVSLGETSS